MDDLKDLNTTQSEKKRKNRRPLIRPMFFFMFIAVLFLAYISDYYKADDDVRQYLESTELVQVVDIKEGLLLDGPGTEYGFIFYPGGKVEYIAYLPMLHRLSLYGIDCFLVKMPLNLAVLNSGKASGILDSYAYEKWYIGGHSLGGSMSALYAAGHKLDGLILLASYAMREVDERTLELYGSEDGVLNMDNRAYGDAFLPAGSVIEVIKGGNHAWFGNYGEQKGDGKATITREAQQEYTVERIREFIMQ
jgi:hypothetical protein